MKPILGTLLLATLIVGCAPSSPDTSSIDVDEALASIEQTRAAFTAALKEGRYEDLANLVTPDAKTVGPGSADWALMYQLGESRGTPFPYDSIAMRPTETVVMNDSVAWDFGTSTVYFTGEDGEVRELHDTFLAILKRGQDGVWRLHREVASSSVDGP